MIAAPRHVHGRDLVRWLAVLAASTAAFVAVLRIAVRGRAPEAMVAVLAPAAFLAMVVATFQMLVAAGPCAFDERGAPRGLLRRHGFWLVALATCLALPTLGASGLVDPWETHYAEVAREMIERRDFVSPWWANEGWFFSKPILLFWLEAAAMTLFGVRTGPDLVLAGGAHPEWAVRFPAFAFAVVGAYALYHGVSRTVGRRAGFVGAVILWTAPGYLLLSHQGMTDVPLLGGVAASLGLLLRALSTSDAEVTRPHVLSIGERTISVHAGQLVGAALLVATTAQLVVLATSRSGAGSPHACGLPGQPACLALRAAHPGFGRLALVALFAPLSIWLAASVAEDRRVGRLLAIGGWCCAAIAAMAKGPIGLVLPVAGVLLGCLRSPRQLLRLAPVAGLFTMIALVLPWYLAAWARHGRPFVDELVMRHMLGRAIEHLHDTNDGEDVGLGYYVRQLGYATFPWSGIVAGAVLASTGRRDDGARRTRARATLFGAALGAFVLVSWMRTKFHHYALVALPPLAMLAGMFVDELLGEASSDKGRARRVFGRLAAALAAGVTALVGLDLARAPARFVLLFTYKYSREWPSTRAFATAIAVLAGSACVAFVALAIRRWRSRALGAATVAATALSAILVDAYLPRCASDGGQRGVLEAYYRDRPRDARGPLVAYQLNWKGENFYSGNHLSIFVSSGAPFRAYVDRRRATEGERTVFFVTERRRVAALRAELGEVRAFAEVTGPEVSSEFTLVRAEL